MRHIWLKAFLLARVMAKRRPRTGDRILILKEKWLKMILLKKKTLEVRSRPLKSGHWWLGCKGFISGEALIGSAFQIHDMATWDEHQARHCVEAKCLPYKKTCGHPILHVRKVIPTSFVHPKGAVGIVIYKEAPSQPEQDK